MSLVLEALKRQEADANPDAAVALATQASQRQRHRLWKTLFLFAMAANAVIVVWLVGIPDGWRGAVEPTASRAAVQPPVPTPVTEPAPRRTRPHPDTTAGSHAVAAEATRPKRAPAPPAKPARERIMLADLPPRDRQRFPGIAFSTHIYAEDPDLRAIVANGRRLTEGEHIRGLEILRITEDGVVLGFERYAVEVPIVTNWDVP